MRPPILQWKVALALLTLVLVGATLGSVLHSSADRVMTTHFTQGQSRRVPLLPIGQDLGRDIFIQSGRPRLFGLLERLVPSLGGGTQVGGWTGYSPLQSGVHLREVCAALRGKIPRRQLPSFCHKHH